MEFQLYNTFTRSQAPISPVDPQRITVYTCGPTVYGAAHIGNFRAFIAEDILVRSLRYLGHTVYRVMNITDVGHLVGDGDEGEDKMSVGAKREGKTAWEVAAHYTQVFLQDMATLKLEVPDALIKATDTITEQIAFIQDLEAKGHTYTTRDGVYFDSTSIPDYGKLARLDLDALQAGARVEMGEKRSPTDFALWKFSGTPGERHMEWESPWGLGFPGWHIECSAIIASSIGETVDIHCGGQDHIALHHTDEIAQSEARHGVELARHWMHVAFLTVDGGKMSKSLQNDYTIAQLQEHGIEPLAFKLFTFGAHYRVPTNFTWEAAEAAQNRLRRWRERYQAAPEGVAPELSQGMRERLADDLDLPGLLALIDANQDAPRGFWEEVESVLQLGITKQTTIPDEVLAYAHQREVARQAGDWAEADRLRDAIAEAGFDIRDTASGFELFAR